MGTTMLTRAAELAQFGDAEIVEAIYDLVAKIMSDEMSTEFFFLLAEAFERFAPEVELQITRWRNVDGVEGLEHAIESMGVRHVARLTARAVRQQKREGEDA